MNKALIIFDWDDTLFPTYWLFDNKIKLNNADDVKYYLLYFQELDNILVKLLKKSLQFGSVIIITNANGSWVQQSAHSLPKAYDFINRNIKVISARDMYQETHDVYDWKILTFNYDIFNDVNSAQQIISFGDAEYEHNALISLSRNRTTCKYLKLIRLVKNPSFDVILDQLNSLIKALPEICMKESHLDLIFQ